MTEFRGVVKDVRGQEVVAWPTRGQEFREAARDSRADDFKLKDNDVLFFNTLTTYLSAEADLKETHSSSFEAHERKIPSK